MDAGIDPSEKVTSPDAPTSDRPAPIRTMVDEAFIRTVAIVGTNVYRLGPTVDRAGEAIARYYCQCLYSIHSERTPMEQLEYNLLFLWFVGLNMDEPVWVRTVFSKNRDRLLTGDIAERFFVQVLNQVRASNPLSDEHSSVDET